MDFFSQTYIALRGPAGGPQNAQDVVGRLSDRLSPATLLADRRAAVLSLKGLSRDCKADVGAHALPGLLGVLYNDSEVDVDTGKAVIEAIYQLCEVEAESPDAERLTQVDVELGYKHMDAVLQTEAPVNKLFALLADQSFYIRFGTLQLLGRLLMHRRATVQAYFLKAPGGPENIIAVLEDNREIIRNEALATFQALVTQSPDIQKILAFSGAFEKLFAIVSREGGVETGGVVVAECLSCIDALLRFNSSNQTYFRESALPAALLSLLLFPPDLPPHAPAPQEFALQFWEDAQKKVNCGWVVGLVGLLASSKGNSPSESSVFVRCLVEIGLSSNAPTGLKTQALRLLPATLTYPLSELTLTPYVPVPETNGEEWDRLEPTSALDVLVELALQGEYVGLGPEADNLGKEAVELRGVAVNVFENYVRKEDIRLAILSAMAPPPAQSPAPTSQGQPAEPVPMTPLLHALTLPPTAPLDPATGLSIQLATLLFAALVRGSTRAKALARGIYPSAAAPYVPSTPAPASNSTFFVPADGAPPPAAARDPVAEADSDEDGEHQSLLQVLSEYVSLALLARAHAVSTKSQADPEAREWNRLVVAYLALLAQWLWEDAKGVREFLEAGALGVLVEPINQQEVDVLVQGLCAFVLGVCYEYNREPGEITRTTMHPILNRLGADNLVARMTRVREDERFKAVTPESLVLPLLPSSTSNNAIQSHSYGGAGTASLQSPGVGSQSGSGKHDVEVWFDWDFVDFWKSNHYSVQRAVGTDPDALSSSTSGPDAETAMLLTSLRDMVRKQANDIEVLTAQLQGLTAERDTERQALQAQLASTTAALTEAQQKRAESEKEQEDLLVFLEELSQKRRRDKARMREKGMEVSEDEGDEEGEDGS